MLKDLCTLPSDLYRNRRLVKKMAKNDLKSRFAGSYFGTIWAFIQPIVTILEERWTRTRRACFPSVWEKPPSSAIF